MECRQICEPFVVWVVLEKKLDYFNLDWKTQLSNLLVVFGALIGGFVVVHFMSYSSIVAINSKTIAQLAKLGIDAPNGKLLPNPLFGKDVFESPKTILILIIGCFYRLWLAICKWV